MEPGERHREHAPVAASNPTGATVPQWSPVNVTGNTPVRRACCPGPAVAAMEPGERHREHGGGQFERTWQPLLAAMEPGERHREHTADKYYPKDRDNCGRNGAR